MDPYDELADFLARGPSTRELAEHHLADESCRYLEDLIRKGKVDRLTDAEHEVVVRCMQVEHLMTRVKAKARRLLKEQSPTEVAAGPAEASHADESLAAA